ncbi:hypothetical protein LINPERHAP1_LOCUS19320 [Linum perenne]
MMNLLPFFYEHFQPMPTFLNKTAPHFKIHKVDNLVSYKNDKDSAEE